MKNNILLRRQKKSYVWNMTAGILNAFQSVFLLVVITRVLSLYDAGVFTIAYATANLTLTIGKYGMRPYQVTDVGEKYSFSNYRGSRWRTSIAMMAISTTYVIVMIFTNEYTFEKASVVFLMCVLKTIDSVEDIYHGMYQQRGRLDIAALLLTCRMIVTIMFFSIMIIILKDLVLSLLMTIIVSGMFFLISIQVTLSQFEGIDGKSERCSIKKLLIECLPMFLGSFLSFYIMNAPKYAIDILLSEELQACYGFIAMPVFVVGLLNNFIYQPILTKLAIQWNNNKQKEFVKGIVHQCGYVIVITVITLVGGYILGIPFLSMLYNTDLSLYRAELMVLLISGGFFALSGFLTIALTIIRYQKSILWCCLIVSIFAYILSPICVTKYAIMGASGLYLVLMILQSTIYCILFFYKIKRERKFI